MRRDRGVCPGISASLDSSIAARLLFVFLLFVGAFFCFVKNVFSLSLLLVKFKKRVFLTTIVCIISTKEM